MNFRPLLGNFDPRYSLIACTFFLLSILPDQCVTYLKIPKNITYFEDVQIILVLPFFKIASFIRSKKMLLSCIHNQGLSDP